MQCDPESIGRPAWWSRCGTIVTILYPKTKNKEKKIRMRDTRRGRCVCGKAFKGGRDGIWPSPSRLLWSPARLTTCTLCSSVIDRSVMAYGNRASATMVVNDPSGASISLKVGGYWKNPESLVDIVGPQTDPAWCWYPLVA